MQVSLVIPTLYFEDKTDIFTKCISSMYGQFDELIVIAENLDNLSSKINLGMSKATGDYIVVANDDVTMFQKTLRDLCDPDAVTVPRVIGGIDKPFHGHMWCMPRKIYEDVGPQWEGYDGFYYDDSDYWMMIESKGHKIVKREDVVILHPHPATTLRRIQKEGREDTNRQRFIERWGKQALNKIQ